MSCLRAERTHRFVSERNELTRDPAHDQGSLVLCQRRIEPRIESVYVVERAADRKQPGVLGPSTFPATTPNAVDDLAIAHDEHGNLGQLAARNNARDVRPAICSAILP